MGQIQRRESVVHVVNVGKNGNFYDPDSIVASAGDIISFKFFPTNHTVVRAEYKLPCIPYEDTGSGKTGFFSGYHPLAQIADNPPTWNLTVNDTSPVFFYCTAPDSCIGNQMVGVINPNETMTLDVQKEFAANASYMLVPGEPFPNEGSNPTQTASTMATSTMSSTPSPSSSSSSNAASTSSSQTSLSPGAIAGIVVGAVAFLVILLVLRRFVRDFLAHYRRRRADPQPTLRGPNKRSPQDSVYAPPSELDSPEMRDHGPGAFDSPVSQGWPTHETRPERFRESSFGKPMGLQIHMPTATEHPPQELEGR